MAHCLITSFTKIFGLKCWARNSYYFDNIVPGLSDIDFTILLNSERSRREIQLFLKLYSLFKRFIPILGEINIYEQKDLSSAATWINWYELKRDPMLFNLVEALSPKNGDKFVYLLRLLESDAFNLISRPSQRHKKWQRHFQEVELCCPNEITLLNTISAILPCSPITQKHNETKSFLSYYLSHNQSETYQNLHCDEKERLFIIMYPHRWLVAANGERSLVSTLRRLRFTEEELEIICAQLKWEVNGLYTQKFTLPDTSSLMTYIDMIMNFLVLLEDMKEQEYISLIDSFKALKKSLARY